MKKTAIVLFLLFVASSAFSQAEIKEYKAAENLYLVGDRVYSLYYITNDGVIVIDPINDSIAAATWRSIRRHTSLPVKYVVYSHNHWDHNGGGELYKKSGARFIMHEQALAHLAEGAKITKPDSVWSGAKTIIHSGKRQIELYYFGKNHGNGMTVFRFPEHNALFAVDLVVPDRVLYAYLPDASPKRWLDDLYQIRQLPFDTLYMAHVRPIGTRKDLDFQIRYFEDLYAATEKALRDGVPFFDIPRMVKLPQYKHLLFYDDWLHLNVWRILMEKTIGQ